MKELTRLVLLFLGFSMAGCSDNNTAETVFPEYEAYQNEIKRSGDQAVDLVRKSISYVGGWEAYINLRGIEYQKTLHKADSTGNIVSQVTQHHRYNVFPEFGVSMDWEEGGSRYAIMNNGNQSWKLKDGSHMQDQKNVNSAYNSSHGSQYVLFMPWKLLDPGVQLKYVGIQQLPNGLEGEGIQVNYSEDNSTTTTHTWWYYFDLEGKPIANFLESDQGYSYTEYLEYEEVEGLKFHVKRNSYRSDSTRTNISLSTIYENDEIMLRPSFEENLFDFKG